MPSQAQTYLIQILLNILDLDVVSYERFRLILNDMKNVTRAI